MHPGNDYSSYYPQSYAPSPPISNPDPNSAPIPPSFASAPPYNSPYPTSDHNPYYAPNPPTAPSFSDPYNSTSSYPLETPQPNYPHLQQSPSLPYYSHDPTYQSGRYPQTSNPVGGPTVPPPPHDSSFPGSYPSYDGGYQGGAHLNDNSNSGGYGGGYQDGVHLSENSNSGGGYGGYERDFFDGGSGNGLRFDRLNLGDDRINDGAYAYKGGNSEPYGARGTVPTRSPALFDDYGRPITAPSGEKDYSGSGSKIVRAVPKAETQQDVKNGVQKYRVRLLSESGGSAQDVLCQIGLDGIRMLDPSTNRTLRIHPLEHLTRWEITDSSTFSFWSKSSVDIEPRRIRLQSNSYTTNTILDTVTAATVQLKEMGGNDSLTRGKVSADAKQTELAAEKKKGLIDWMNLIKPVNEEKDHWVPDDVVNKCTACGSDFGAFNRRHHCRNCGDIFCDKCTQGRIALTNEENAQPVRVCDRCMAEVSQRLTNAKEAANRPAALHSHEDLARKLQEEMEKNRKSSLGSKSSNSSGRRMREVACPICTVHLQVQVPASGSETIECGVCQHPFLVSAH